jgi:hypothetical protein
MARDFVSCHRRQLHAVIDPALCSLIEEAGANASRPAAQFLGVNAEEQHGYQDWHHALAGYARQGPAALVMTAAAVVAARGEQQLRGGYRQHAIPSPTRRLRIRTRSRRVRRERRPRPGGVDRLAVRR